MWKGDTVAVSERKFRVDAGSMPVLLGINDANLQAVEKRFDASIVVRGDTVTLRGEATEVEQIERVFKELLFLLARNNSLTVNDVETVIDLVVANG